MSFVPSPSRATGVLFHSHDAKTAGMGIAVTASSDNASAVIYNPAMLPYQKGFGFSVTENLVFQELKFTSGVTGNSEKLKAETVKVPAYFIKQTVNNFSFGIGIFSLFGLSIEWASHWEGRYVTYLSSLNAVHLNPVAAYKFNDHFSLGVGISYIDSSFVQKNAVNLGLAGDGASRLTADGKGWGYNIGATINFFDQYTFGMTFRSPIKIDYSGKASFYAPGPAANLFQNGTISSQMNFPYIFMLGLAKKTKDLTLEIDARLTGWSSVRGTQIVFESGKPATSQYLPRNWTNSWAVMIGANYVLNKFMELRAGYIYDETPVPASTLGPLPADLSRNIITAGIGLRISDFLFDIGYLGGFGIARSTRTTTLPGSGQTPLIGKYEGQTHAVVFTFGTRFNFNNQK